jgi:hypothetical protein
MNIDWPCFDYSVHLFSRNYNDFVFAGLCFCLGSHAFNKLGIIHLTWNEGRLGIIALTRVAKHLQYLLLEMPDCIGWCVPMQYRVSSIIQ